MSDTDASMVGTPDQTEVNIRKLRIAPPDVFNGDKSKYLRFKRQLYIYIASDPTIRNNDQAKILLALSYMKEGTAALWAEERIDRVMSNPDAGFGTFDGFFRDMEEAFNDINGQQLAQAELENHHQGRTTAEEFFFKFDQLVNRAGYSQNHDHYLIALLERNLHQALVDRIYSTTPLPSTYAGWKQKVIELDQLWRRREERKKVNKEFWNLPNSQSLAYDSKRNEGQKESRTSPSGRTFGGLGKPMEIDRAKYRSEGRCFGCGEAGHISRFCPNKEKVLSNMQTRRVDIKEWTSEEKMMIFEDLMKEKEMTSSTEDFVESQ